MRIYLLKMAIFHGHVKKLAEGNSILCRTHVLYQITKNCSVLLRSKAWSLVLLLFFLKPSGFEHWGIQQLSGWSSLSQQVKFVSFSHVFPFWTNPCHVQLHSSWVNEYLVAGIRTPLKNDGVRQWEGWHPIYDMENNPFMFETTNQYINHH